MLGLLQHRPHYHFSIPSAPLWPENKSVLGPLQLPVSVTKTLQVPSKSFFLFRDDRVQETVKRPFHGPTTSVSIPVTLLRPTGVTNTHCLECRPRPLPVPLIFLTALILGDFLLFSFQE